ncbi:hypothetical protein BpHYR1_024282 [Brachionus plicatilis]|uniref:Nbr1 FW domain-containing protein n=1 Tax=Brachionus plicatilis TaxID=10195 RepID=A0A3M7RCB3_BRAPC|nr:hypothetical protein BpHYR1_024282 [Brachionus plicatilis]
MDVDNSDLDMIMCQFRTMNTNDKDYLINEFKRLSNTQLSTEGCCFYLDLAEWNLNSALWAYYEYETAAAAAANASNYSNSPPQFIAEMHNSNERPDMQFLCDITIGEGESVAPNTNFIKTWRIKNTGINKWPLGCQLKYVNGYNFSPATLTCQSPNNTSSFFSNENERPLAIDLKELEPQETMDVSISLKSPQQCGIYQCQYRTYTRYDQPFGDPIWLLLNVEENGLLDCIQQLNNVNMMGNSENCISNNAINRHVSSSVNGFLNQSKKPENLNHSDPNVNKPNIFCLDTNSNFLPEASSLNRNQNQPIEEEEKRPDFYDDMFS